MLNIRVDYCELVRIYLRGSENKCEGILRAEEVHGMYLTCEFRDTYQSVKVDRDALG